MVREKMEDKERIRRIQDGDAEQFRELVAKYYDDVFRFCYYKAGDEQAAYDCTQDTFLHLTRYIASYADRNKFKAYLFTIARNACHDYFRNNPVAGRADEWDRDYGERAGNGCRDARTGEGTAVEDEAIANVETKEMLQRALDRLPDMQREAVVLRFIHDFKLKDIARMTGAPLPTVKSRLRQGLNRMRKMMEGV